MARKSGLGSCKGLGVYTFRQASIYMYSSVKQCHNCSGKERGLIAKAKAEDGLDF